MLKTKSEQIHAAGSAAHKLIKAIEGAKASTLPLQNNLGTKIQTKILPTNSAKPAIKTY